MTSNNFNDTTTTNDVLNGIDLNGKRVLITGGASGLGAETARALAAKGAEVIIAARDMKKAQSVKDAIIASTGNANIHLETLELASLAKIRTFAEQIIAKYDSLNIVINNAGIMACPQGKTEDGFELQFGSNHIGHFYMTCLIMPAILRGAPARIVSLSSLGHRTSPVVFDDIHFENRDYEKWSSYGQSKTANALFAVALHKRLAAKGVEVYAVHPGVIETNLARHMSAEDIAAMRARVSNPETKQRIKSVEQGAATSVYAATAPALTGKGGVYLEDCNIAKEVADDDMASVDGIRRYAIDPANAEKLWAASEEMVGQKFTF